MPAGRPASRAPGLIEPERIDHLVGLPDVAPTILDLAGLPSLPDADGLSLTPYLRDEPGSIHQYVASALLRYVRHPDAPKQFAFIARNLHKIIRTGDDRQYHFDLGDDPDEERALGEPAPALVEALEAWLSGQSSAALSFEDRFGGAVRGAIDADEAQRLRSLGYLD